MYVSKVTVSRTKQIRQYEPERIELEISLTEGESVNTAVARARASIKRQFGEGLSKDQVAEMKAALEEAEAEGF